MVISIEIMFFQVRENLKNISKTNINLTFFTLAKNSPRDFSIFFFTRRGREGPGRESCRSSAVVLTKALVRVELSSANELCKIAFARLKKKKLYVCGAVAHSYKTYSTSRVPLLVRNVSYVCGAVARNSFEYCKTKLKKP